MKGEGRFAGMFKEKEGNKLKIEEIRLSPELLRINSRFTGGGSLAKIILILIVALGLVFYKDIINILKEKYPNEQFVLVSMVLLFLAALIFTIYRMNMISGKTLIITEKGFFIEPLLAQYWKDIDEYRWNTVSEAQKDLFSGKTEGTSLLLFNNKGSWPKTFDLGCLRIFFTPDQMLQVDNIFQRLGIKKTEGINF